MGAATSRNKPHVYGDAAGGGVALDWRHNAWFSVFKRANFEAVHQVLFSADILPVILLHLKELHSPIRWKSGLAPLLRVNRSFLDAGASVLWEEMNDIEHVFKLLPWYDALREIRQMPLGAGSNDWDRFNFYASKIRSITLWSLDEEVPFSWLNGHFSLPGMPVPTFPNLRSAMISPGEILNMTSLSLFLPPSLRTFQITLDVGRPGDIPQVLSLYPEGLLRAIASSAPKLQDLTYTGPTSDDFLVQLSALSGLTTLNLFPSSPHSPQALRCLRKLNLQRLKIMSLEACGCSTEVFSISKLQLDGHDDLDNLRSLEVVSGQYQQCLFARALSPRELTTLHFGIMSPTDAMPFHLSLGLYLKANPNLKTVGADFITRSRVSRPETTPFRLQGDWPSAEEARELLTSALQSSKHLRRLSVDGIPFDMAVPTGVALREALPSFGSSLVLLRMQVQWKYPDVPDEIEAALPGLSFLASSIWLSCPNLKECSFHFNATLVAVEDLDEVIKAWETAQQHLPSESSSADPTPTVGSHGLRRLEIASGSPSLFKAGVSLNLPLPRKMQIAAFLQRLFPKLESVTGSGVWAKKAWVEVDRIINPSGETKAREYGDIDLDDLALTMARFTQSIIMAQELAR